MAIESSDFKSPFCGHTIYGSEIDYRDVVTCECGKTMRSDTIRRFMAQKAITDAAYLAFDAQRKLYDGLYEQLKAQAEQGVQALADQATGSTPAATAVSQPASMATAAPVHQTPVQAASAAPAKPAKPAKPKRPQRAPLSPRTILLLVAALLVLVSATIFEVTTRDLFWGTTFVLVLVGAFGFGAVKLHKSQRNIGNFFAGLSSSLLYLGALALGALWIPLSSVDALNTRTSLYLPLMFLGITGVSALVGRIFKIFGWAVFGPLGLAVTTVMFAVNYVPNHVANQADITWSVLVASAGGLAIGAIGRIAKFAVPHYEEPTDEQKFEIEDATKERGFTRQMIVLGMLVSLGIMTVQYLRVPFGAILNLANSNYDGRLSPIGLVLLGLLWTAAAIGLERFGGKFTESGEVHPLVRRGAWLIGLTHIAGFFSSVASSADPAGSASYTTAVVTSMVALALLVAPRWIGAMRSDAAKDATVVAAWASWIGWWLGTAHPLAFLPSDYQVLEFLLVLISAVWLTARLVLKTERHQGEALIPAALAAVTIAPAVLQGYATTIGAGYLANLALLVVAGSVILAVISFANNFVSKKTDTEVSPIVTQVGVLAHAGLAFTALLLMSGVELTRGGTVLGAISPLLGAALLLAVARLGFLGSPLATKNPALVATANFAAGIYFALPVLVALWFSGSLSNPAAVFSGLFAVELLAVALFAVWKRQEGYGLAAAGLGVALSISLDVQATSGDFGLPGSFVIGLAAFWVIQLALITAFAKRVSSTANRLAGALPILFVLISVTHLAIAVAIKSLSVDPSVRAWEDTLALVAVGAVSVLAARTKRLAVVATLPRNLALSGWISLGFALVSSLTTSGAEGTSVRSITVLLAIAAVAILAKHQNEPGEPAAVPAPVLDIVASLTTKISAVLGAVLAAETGLAAQPIWAVVAGFGTLAGLLSIDALLAGSFKIRTSALINNAFLGLALLLVTPQLLVQLPAIDGRSLALTGDFDTRHAAANLGLVLTAVFGLALLWDALRRWKHSSEAVGAGSAPGAGATVIQPLIVWAFGAFGAVQLYLTAGNRLGVAAWMFLLALILGYHSLVAKARTSAYGSFAPLLLAGWFASVWLVEIPMLPFSLPVVLAGLAAYAVSAWLLARTETQTLNSFAVVLPVTVGLSFGVGGVAAGIVRQDSVDALFPPLVGSTIDWVSALALAFAALWLANIGAVANLKQFRLGVLASAGVSWAAGVLIIVNQTASGSLSQTLNVYLLVTTAVATWYSLRYASRFAAYAAFLAGVGTGWLFTTWLIGALKLPFIQPVNLAGVLAFVLGAWLLRRIDKALLNGYALALPVTVFISYLIGYVQQTGLRLNTQIGPASLQAGFAADTVLVLGFTVTYLWLANGKLAAVVPNMTRSLILSAGLSWVTGLVLVLNHSSSMGVQRFTYYFAATSAVAVWYGLRYANRLAVYGVYLFGLITALLLQLQFAQPAPELFVVAAAAYAVLGTRIHESKIEAFKGTQVRWGAPLGILLVIPALFTVTYSNHAFTTQTALEAGRFIAVVVVSTIGVLVGIPLGNRGITTASTTALMVALVPGLWFRIDEISSSIQVRNETKALLVAVTVYTLIYIFRKNVEVRLPSIVIWGVPALISLSTSFIDAMSALNQSALTSEDWIRFGIVMGAGTVFLTLGAIRRVAGLFYPGLATVVVTVLPYSWHAGGLFWAVLLLLAALIVWVAIKLDRFTGWLKALD